MIRRALVAFAVLSLSPFPALALSPSGPTTSVIESNGATVRFPDLAHDPAHDVWLVVTGQDGVRGRFLDSAGTPLSAEVPLAGAETFSPRVAYAPMLEGFVVCWFDELNHVVDCRQAHPESLGAPVTIDDPNTVEHLESAPDIACTADACLVTWAEAVTGGEIRARRLGPDLSPLGPVFTLSNAPGFDGFPSVDFVPTRDEWLVVWTTEPLDNQQTVAFARIPTNADAALAPPSAFWVHDSLNNYPEVACDPGSGECLAITYFNQGNPDVRGCKLGADGTPSVPFAIAATPGFEGGDGIGLAFNTSTQSWLAVFQGPEAPGETQEVFGTEVTSSPAAEFQVSTAAGDKGIYQPRVAAHSSKPEFLVAMSVDYTHVGVQKVTGESSSIPTDASAGAGGGGAADSGSGASSGSGSGGSAIRGGTEEADGGCGCRTAPARQPAWPFAIALALFSIGRGSRRSRARRLRSARGRARPRA
jgi:hypothetical protein